MRVIKISRIVGRRWSRARYKVECGSTIPLLHTNAYGYVYDPIGQQKSAKPKTLSQGGRDFEAARKRGVRSDVPQRSGNCHRLVSTVNGAGTSYTANHLNQYTAINSAIYSATPQYDRDGNLITLGDRAYTYDAENRLSFISATNAAFILANTYDHQHRRIQKATQSAVHNFIYDGWNLLRETALSNGVSSTVDYFWGSDISGTLQGAGGVGGLLAASITGQFYFPLYDANGNVAEYIDESGTVRAHYEYSPFGEITAQSGDMADVFRFRFSTKYYDSETGHYYYGRRFYAPKLGRWLNRDPAEEEGGINLYSFVLNDAVNWFDDIGLRRRSRNQNLSLGNFDGAHRFIWHFYTGNGEPVDIGDWGYLGHYRSARDVQKFECEARNKARSSVDDCCAKGGRQWQGTYSRIADGTDGLYVMGNGRPQAGWTCTMKGGSVTCKIHYAITDSFQDPVDLDSHVNRRLPDWAPRIPERAYNLGGTPYALNAAWRDTVDGCSKPEDCGLNSGGRRSR